MDFPSWLTTIFPGVQRMTWVAFRWSRWFSPYFQRGFAVPTTIYGIRFIMVDGSLTIGREPSKCHGAGVPRAGCARSGAAKVAEQGAMLKSVEQRYDITRLYIYLYICNKYIYIYVINTYIYVCIVYINICIICIYIYICIICIYIYICIIYICVLYIYIYYIYIYVHMYMSYIYIYIFHYIPIFWIGCVWSCIQLYGLRGDTPTMGLLDRPLDGEH